MIRQIMCGFKFLLPLYGRIKPYKKNRLYRSLFHRRRGQREMVLCEDDFYVMGGLCDRLNGIVSLYKHCKENDIPFKINFIKPFNLVDFLEPNAYDWRITSSEVDYLHSHLRFVEMLDLEWKDFEQYFNAQTNQVKRMIKKWKKGPMICWSNAHIVRKEEFSSLFYELFTPSKAVQDEIDMNMNNIGGAFVGVTIRFQNRLGDFKEANVKELEPYQKQQLIEKCKNKVVELHDKMPDKKFLLTSDSRTFLNVMDSYDFIYTIPGKLVHMSYTVGKNIDAYIKGFVDLLVLSKADAIYLLITDDMWRSSFPETASYIGNRDYFEIRF